MSPAEPIHRRPAKTRFKTTLTSALAALGLGAALLATSAPAEAGWGYRHRYGGAVAAGVFTGLAVGALAASSRPAYAEPVYTDVGACYVVQRRVVNEFGDLVIRRERVCE
jgi:hypothetical protein